MSIFVLNEYVLLKILSYLSDHDLQNLIQTSKRFEDFITYGIYAPKTVNLLMCSTCKNAQINRRNCSPLSFYERIRIASNWSTGRYKETISFPRKKLFFTKTHLESDKFYITNGSYLRIYDRNPNEPDSIDKSDYLEISSKNYKSDISNFVKRNEDIFIGQTSGNGILYDAESFLQTEQTLHGVNEYLTCVDFQDNIYVSGSDQRFKIWKKEVEFDELVSLDLQYNFWNYFMCAKISRGKVFGGLYADVQQRRALREIDIETGNVDILHCNSFSIYDLKIKDDNILYTGHFDTTTRVFDRRTDTDEIIFIDPFDSSAYCIDHDGKYALLCGTKHHSRVNLYDIRVPNRVAQIYYPVRQKRKESSPVYSLCCDSRFLFIATDINLRVFDFKADWAKVKDYSNIISKSRIEPYSIQSRWRDQPRHLASNSIIR